MQISFACIGFDSIQERKGTGQESPSTRLAGKRSWRYVRFCVSDQEIILQKGLVILCGEYGRYFVEYSMGRG